MIQREGRTKTRVMGAPMTVRGVTKKVRGGQTTVRRAPTLRTWVRVAPTMSTWVRVTTTMTRSVRVTPTMATRATMSSHDGDLRTLKGIHFAVWIWYRWGTF